MVYFFQFLFYIIFDALGPSFGTNSEQREHGNETIVSKVPKAQIKVTLWATFRLCRELVFVPILPILADDPGIYLKTAVKPCATTYIKNV
ncbi:hypothetical protein FKM82_010675 [Ascaphus truei]